MSTNLENASNLITGGTGSFGKAFLEEVLTRHSPRRVVIFSRDELKQYEMRQKWGDDPRVRFFLGDIRDLDRLTLALHGVDLVVHAAALKQVDTAEYNPMEYVKTNILGSENVIQASIAAGVKKVVALSTDKASSPVNLYGATKLTADKLFISSNHYSYARGTSFSVVRYGNVMGSRGSVIPFFRRLASEGTPLPITDMRMTRFWITLPQAVDFVITSFADMTGGELYVPRIPSMRVVDLADSAEDDGVRLRAACAVPAMLRELLELERETAVQAESIKIEYVNDWRTTPTVFSHDAAVRAIAARSESADVVDGDGRQGEG